MQTGEAHKHAILYLQEAWKQIINFSGNGLAVADLARNFNDTRHCLVEWTVFEHIVDCRLAFFLSTIGRCLNLTLVAEPLFLGPIEPASEAAHVVRCKSLAIMPQI